MKDKLQRVEGDLFKFAEEYIPLYLSLDLLILISNVSIHIFLRMRDLAGEVEVENPIQEMWHQDFKKDKRNQPMPRASLALEQVEAHILSGPPCRASGQGLVKDLHPLTGTHMHQLMACHLILWILAMDQGRHLTCKVTLLAE